MAVGLYLVVIRVSDLQRALGFYEALGLRFSEEQHGDGPKHLAAEVGDVIFEMYPAGDGPTTAGVRLGFRVPSVAAAVAAVEKQAARVVSGGSGPPRRRPAVVADPDGHRIEISEYPGST